MHTLRRRAGAHIYVMVADLDEAYHETVRKLEFEPVDGGFARRFAADSPHLERIYANLARGHRRDLAESRCALCSLGPRVRHSSPPHGCA